MLADYGSLWLLGTHVSPLARGVKDQSPHSSLPSFVQVSRTQGLGDPHVYTLILVGYHICICVQGDAKGVGMVEFG